MTAFWRSGETVCAVVDEPEAQLVRRLVTDVQAMLTGDGTAGGSDAGLDVGVLDWPEAGSPATPPEDPALARLLPDGYSDDPDAAAELRRLTERSLRDAKSRAAQRLLDSLPGDGGSLSLDLPTAEAWLAALNDVRLVLGTRLNVTEDTAENQARGLHEGDDPVAVAYQVYCWLSVVQDDLVAAVCA
ncbi:MAG TPA: DUF2017 domain-containing protein [Mycobacteriales bacterium]|nr:DUF2017 domain-containing protein [Mycobacteriales bacterium]